MDYQAVIKIRLNDLLNQNGQLSLKGKAVHFASEDSVCYRDWTIQKSSILQQDSINNFLETKAEG
jgi:hypothetical protein